MSRSEDPLVEAGRWLDAKLAGAPVPKLLLVIGLGEGHLLDVLATRAPETKVLALEPDARAARAFRERRDWSDWLNAGRLVYLTAPDYAGADEAWRIFPPGEDAHKLLSHPSIEGSPTPAAIEAARVLKKILFGVKANAAARRRFAAPYLLNTLRNLPAIVSGSDVRALADAFRGIPAIVVGAGPSLDRSIAELRDIAGRALIISTDTAVRPLLNAGVTPPLAVGLDPGAANAQHFKLLPNTSGTWLVSEAALDPIAADGFDDRTFWFRVAPHHPWPWYNELGIDVGKLDVWASVLTAAFELAVLAGADPIVFVGSDLAFTDARPYCRGTAYEFEWALTAARGGDLETTWAAQMGRSERLQQPDVHGRQTTTTRTLSEVRDWLVGRASRSGRRVINATGGGILFGGGIEQSASLRDVLSAASAAPRVSEIPRQPPSRISPSALEPHVRDARRAIAGELPLPPSVAAWAVFCGDSYDPAAIGAALDEAAGTLDAGAGRRQPADTPASILARLIASPTINPVVGRLPEAIARLRAAVRGDAPLPEAPMRLLSNERQGAPDRLLPDAFDLLCAIYGVVAEAEDLPAPVPGYLIGDPISAYCAWPDAPAKAAQMFEGLLGNAWTQPLPEQARAFYLGTAPPPTHVREPDAGAVETSVRPNTTAAAALLAAEWLLCAANDANFSADEIARFTTVLHWVAAAFQSTVTPSLDEEGGQIQIRVDAGAPSATLTLPLPDGGRALAPLAPAGAKPGADDLPWELARIATRGGLVATITVKTAAVPAQVEAAGETSRHVRLWIPPRVLDAGPVTRALVSHPVPHGAVIAPMAGEHHGLDTVVMHEDGSIAPHHSWPRPVLFELPLEIGGTLAWGQGAPDYVRGWVMHRDHPDAPGLVEELPFIPAAGTWWRGRMYWACWPSGVGSWAPGEEVTFSLPDLSICGITGDDSGLLLEPWLLVNGGIERRVLTHGWKWQPGRDPEPVALGPYGAASCRSTAGGWTAAAHPAADVVTLETTRGVTLVLPCDFPFRVAWAGRSLLVGMVGGQLLMFDRLLDRLPTL